MAKVRKQENHGNVRWVVDWYDHLGQRRQAFFSTRAAADVKLAEMLRTTGTRAAPLVDPASTVRAYSDHWLVAGKARWKPRTHRSYADTLRLHVWDVPASKTQTFGALRVGRLTRAHGKALLVTKLNEGRARNSVRIILATLHALGESAVEDGLLVTNPFHGLGKVLPKKAARDATQVDDIKAFTIAQLDRFLTVARTKVPRLAPLLLVGARTGLRLGELLGLEWTDVDLTSRTLTVRRSLGQDGETGTPKNGTGRRVDLSTQATDTLRRLQVERKAETLAAGWRTLPAPVFVTTTATAYAQRNVLRDFKSILKAAGLPGHFSPHSLRHTFATQHLGAGTSIAYVQQQLGHASIQLTVDTYGSWIPRRDPAAADRLDQLPVSEVVSGVGA